MPWTPLFRDRMTYVPVVSNGELTPDAKAIIELVSRIRTEGSNGTVVLATGHATPEGHVLITKPEMDTT